MVSCALEPELPCLHTLPSSLGSSWEGAVGLGRGWLGAADMRVLVYSCVLPQPSQLFTLGASEHSPVKTPYFDAGVSCADQVGASGETRVGLGGGLRVGGQGWVEWSDL